MPDFCLTEFINASKGVLSKKQSKEVLDELRARAKIKQESENIKRASAMNKSVEEMIAEEEHAHSIRKRNAYLNLRVSKNIQDHISNFPNPLLGLRSYLDGIQSNIPKSRFSTGAVQKGYVEKLMGSLYVKLSKNDLVPLFADKNFESDISSALFDETSVDNPKVKLIARAIKETYEESVQLLNERGADISQLDEYIARQTHNPEKLLWVSDDLSGRIKRRVELRIGQKMSAQEVSDIMRDQAFERWKNYILPRLDTVKTFERVATTPDKFLRSAYEGIVTGEHLKPENEEFKGEFDFKGPFNRASKLSASRKLHFKDGKSWYEYNKKYGNGSVQMSIVKSLEQSGENIGLLEKWGPNPRAMFDKIKKEVEIQALREKKLPKNKVSRSLNFSDAIFKELEGITRIPVDGLWAKINSSFRAWTSMSKLGLVFLSALPDFALRASITRDHGMGFLDSYGNIFADSLRSIGKIPKDRKEFAALMGVWGKAQFGHMAARFMASDTLSGTMSKLMQTFFKYTGLDWLDEVNRGGISIMLSKRLAQLKNVEFNNIPLEEKRILTTYGIEQKEWDVIRHPDNVNTAWKNEQYITPDSANYYTEESLAKYLGKDKLSSNELGAIRNKFETLLRTYFIDQTDMGHMQPGATERAFFNRGTQPGTVWGEAARYVGQFRFFTLGYMKRIIGRYLFRNGSIKNMTKKDIMGLVEVVAMSTALGYVSILSRSVLKGLIPPLFNNDFKNDLKIMTASLEQGGGLGIFGDFLFGEDDRFGHGILTDIAGPSLGTLNDAARLLLKISRFDNPDKSALALAENNTIFLNLWFARTALNYMFLWGLQEKISPGSLRRMKNNLQKNQGKKYIFDPTRYAIQF